MAKRLKDSSIDLEFLQVASGAVTAKLPDRTDPAEPIKLLAVKAGPLFDSDLHSAKLRGRPTLRQPAAE